MLVCVIGRKLIWKYLQVGKMQAFISLSIIFCLALLTIGTIGMLKCPSHNWKDLSNHKIFLGVVV